MFLRTNDSKEVERYINDYFSLYKAKINELIAKIIKSENLYGFSDTQYILNQFHYTLHLIILIYIEYKRGFNTDWNYYINKYELTTVSRKIACIGLRLNDILSIFDLPYINDVKYGIGIVSVEKDLTVENIITNTENVKELFDITFPLKNEIVFNTTETSNVVTIIDNVLLKTSDEDLINVNNTLLLYN